MHSETGERFAIKILDKETIQQHNMGNQVKKEISIMKMIHHGARARTRDESPRPFLARAFCQ